MTRGISKDIPEQKLTKSVTLFSGFQLGHGLDSLTIYVPRASYWEISSSSMQTAAKPTFLNGDSHSNTPL